MILLIDNYDSFTYNLAQFLGQLGEELDVRRNDQITLDQIAAKMPDRIVISPGPGVPEKAGICVDLIRRFAGQVPILGVCLGHQAIGHAFGGRVIRAPEIMHGKTSRIHHDRQNDIPGIAAGFRRYPLSFADRGTRVAARAAGNIGGNFRWLDYGIAKPEAAPGRRSVPSRIGAYRSRHADAAQFYFDLKCSRRNASSVTLHRIANRS